MRKYQFSTVISFFLLVLTRHAQAQDGLMEQQYDALTESGWAVHSRVVVSADGAQMPKDALLEMSPCAQSEVLELRRDATYIRTFRKKDCPGKAMQETNGTWEYASDDKILEGILTIQLTDLVDPGLSRSYSVGSIAVSQGILMLTSMPDDKPMEPREVTVYRRAKAVEPAAAAIPAIAAIPAAPATPAQTELVQALIDLNSEVISNAKNLDEVFSLDRQSEVEFGILEYSNKQTETGPYQLIGYTSGKNEKYLVDLQTDYTGSRMVIYAKKQDAWSDVTGTILGDDFEEKTLSAGFDVWKEKYSDGTVAKDKSEQQLVYELSSAANFLTRNPNVLVQIKVTWTDRKGKEQEDTRILGEMTFNDKTFELIWSE